jgi:biopolymer transport protein ExbB
MKPYQEAPLQIEKTISLIELIREGGFGGQIIIGILFILLISVIYIYFERLFAIKSASKLSSNFMGQIKTYVLNNKIDGAQALCLSENKPVARLVAKGLSRIGPHLRTLVLQLRMPVDLRFTNWKKTSVFLPLLQERLQ